MTSITPLSEVLGLRRAKHLLRRASFHYSKNTIDAFAQLTASQAVAQLLQPTTNTLLEPYDPLPTDNPDGYWLSSDLDPSKFSGMGRKRSYIAAWWLYNGINEISLKHKLTFFLHTSFTVGKDSGAGNSSNFFDHLRLLEYFSYGNIKTLAKKITLDNSMLDYLDNTANNANNPNENYAREFLELFTILKGTQIGEGDYTNYTEIDVQQAAKVFSGFKKKSDRTIIDSETGIPCGYPNKNRHDQEDKQFSHAFGNAVIKGEDTAEGMLKELDDFVEMVFQQEETSKSYAKKLYRFFVKSEWDETVENTIIKGLAETLKNNNFEIVPAITQLLTSKHFYDEDDAVNTDEIIGSIVKSPLQLFSEVFTFFNIQPENPHTEPHKFYTAFFFRFINGAFLGGAGLDIFNPESVAGYPAHYQEPSYDRHWFSSTTIISRYKLMESFIVGKNTISGGRIYNSFDTLSFIETNVSDPTNAITIIDELTNYLFPESIDQSRKDYFLATFLDDYSPYYWTKTWESYKNNGDTSTVKNLLHPLLIAIVNATEFQVM